MCVNISLSASARGRLLLCTIAVDAAAGVDINIRVVFDLFETTRSI